MKDRSNSLFPSQVGQHPGVLPACKVQRSIAALMQEQELPCRNRIFLPLGSVGTSHGQGQAPSQLHQTSSQPCPGDP